MTTFNIRFQNVRSFNVSDGASNMVEGRIQVRTNVQERCERVLDAMRNSNVGLSPKDILGKMSAYAYSYTNVVYALKRLTDNGSVVSVGSGLYRAV